MATRRNSVLIAFPLLTLLACSSGNCAPPQLVPASIPKDAEISFLVAADAHFGAEGIEQRHRRQIEAMNSMAGRRFPDNVGGRVATPRGVLFAGDLTDHGFPWEWFAFVRHYGLTGKDGLLKFPVFEAHGNHDRYFPPTLIPRRVASRHGGVPYAWDWGRVHVVCLGLYPDSDALEWLRQHLAAVGTTRPVVIYFHYNLVGPFSDWWDEDEKTAFANVIRGHNIAGIFNGHYHGSRHRPWNGFDTYVVGSPKHAARRFLVVRFQGNTMSVAAWDWDRSRWDWTHTKRVDGSLHVTVR